jgi:hypothetical protein
VLLGTTWGTPYEHDENTLRTRDKKSKKLLHDSPHPTKKKTGPLRSAY